MNDKEDVHNYNQPVKSIPGQYIKKQGLPANYNSNSEVQLKRKDQLANAYLPKLNQNNLQQLPINPDIGSNIAASRISSTIDITPNNQIPSKMNRHEKNSSVNMLP